MGLNNYRYFVSFLFWTFLGTLFLCLLCAPSVYSGSHTAVARMSAHRGLPAPEPVFPIPDAFAAEDNAALSQWQGGGVGVGRQEEQLMREKKPPKHGLAAMYESLQMLRLLLWSSPPRHGEDAAAARSRRRTSALPEPGQDLPALPVAPHLHQHLRGRVGGGGGYDLERFSALDVLLRPGQFNQLVTLFPADNLPVLVTFVLTMSVHIGVAILFFFHAYLIATAQTTLEFNLQMHRPGAAGGAARSRYDRGSFRDNFEEVFGPGPVLLALLPSWRAPPGDEEAHCRSSSSGLFSRNRQRVDTGYGSLLDV